MNIILSHAADVDISMNCSVFAVITGHNSVFHITSAVVDCSFQPVECVLTSFSGCNPAFNILLMGVC